MAHGVNTTVVEYDPVVYEFATRYFDLKENNPPVLQDAVGYTAQLAKIAPATYDYIVHDVFTGGAEPVDLFTLEFFQSLHALLAPRGTVAIVCEYVILLTFAFPPSPESSHWQIATNRKIQNYAGDLSLPAPKIIYRTIKQVFPTCRIFRETPPDAESIKANKGMDFTNVVIFCKKSPPTEPLTFRHPTLADYLQSSARQEYLGLSHEVPESDMLGEGDDIMRRNETGKVARWHDQSAMGHWGLMRIVIPAFVWEKW